MIKRIGSLFLTVLLLVSLLAACAHRDPEPVIPDTTASPEPVVPQTSPSPNPTDLPDSGEEDGPEPGGWERADSPELTEERVRIFDQAFERLLGADYIPAAYLGKQVVAGTIHAFLARSSVVAPGQRKCMPWYICMKRQMEQPGLSISAAPGFKQQWMNRPPDLSRQKIRC